MTVLPLTILHLLVLAFENGSLINQLLIVRKGRHSQLNSQLIVQSLQKLLLLGCISGHVLWGVTGQLIELINILRYRASSLAQAAELLLLQTHGSS